MTAGPARILLSFYPVVDKRKSWNLLWKSISNSAGHGHLLLQLCRWRM